MKCQWELKAVTDTEWSPQENGSGRYLQRWRKEHRCPGTQAVSLPAPCFPQRASIPFLKRILTITN